MRGRGRFSFRLTSYTVKISDYMASNDMKVSDKSETMWKEAFVG